MIHPRSYIYKNINMQWKEDTQCHYFSTKPHYLLAGFFLIDENSHSVSIENYKALVCCYACTLTHVKNVSSRISRFNEEWVHFLRKAFWENTLLTTQGQCLLACGPRQCSVNDLSAVFIPSFSAGWGQTMNSVSVLAGAQLGSDYSAIVLTGEGCPVGSAVDPGLPWHCQSLFFQLHHPIRKESGCSVPEVRHNK